MCSPEVTLFYDLISGTSLVVPEVIICTFLTVISVYHETENFTLATDNFDKCFWGAEVFPLLINTGHVRMLVIKVR